MIRSEVVEIVGVEPTTPCLQSRCSSQLSYTPVSFLLVDCFVRLRIVSRSLPGGNSLLPRLSSLHSTKINFNYIPKNL